jgi:hypothetical protein
MIRKNKTVQLSQIFKVRAFITRRNKKASMGWEQTYYRETVIIANIDCATYRYNEMLNHVTCDLFNNGDDKKAEVALIVPHIHENGELAYWPDCSKYIQLFRHNIE